MVSPSNDDRGDKSGGASRFLVIEPLVIDPTPDRFAEAPQDATDATAIGNDEMLDETAVRAFCLSAGMSVQVAAALFPRIAHIPPSNVSRG